MQSVSLAMLRQQAPAPDQIDRIYFNPFEIFLFYFFIRIRSRAVNDFKLRHAQSINRRTSFANFTNIHEFNKLPVSLEISHC
jgi:hypothetical protein